MTRCLRPAIIGIAGATLLAVVGCASGPVPAPDVVTLLPYNGEWVLDAAGREPVGLQFASRDGYGFTAVTTRRFVAVMAVRAERFRLEVSDSIFRLSGDQPAFSAAIPLDGNPIEVLGEDGEVQQSVTLTWEAGTPVVRRRIPAVGWVSDRFELTRDGALVLTRTGGMRNSGGREVEATQVRTFVYTRQTGFEQ